jgi:glycosyltransferase involved in cell wall biosynthesis
LVQAARSHDWRIAACASAAARRNARRPEMRVAVFTDNDFDKVNGLTTTLTALLEHAPVDVSPRIYTASSLGTNAPDYLALRSIALPIPFCSETALYLPHPREYLRRIQRDAIDVLHLTTPGPLGLTALWIAARTGLPIVGSLHTDLAKYTTARSGSRSLGLLMAQYVRRVYGRCGQTLAPSNATREQLIELGLPPERVELWRRGVDTALFSPSRRASRLRERWRTSARELVLLYVGTLSRDKSLDGLPEVLYRLRAKGVPHRMVIAGDGPYRKTLAEQIPDAVFTGALDRSDVADVFAAADLFVFPSTDTAGNAVLEAQASGLPVVVSASGGQIEQMLPGVTGLVCEHSDPKRWADVIACLATDERRRGEMGRAARAFALRRRWSDALAPIYQAYRDAVLTTPRRLVAHHAA